MTFYSQDTTLYVWSLGLLKLSRLRQCHFVNDDEGFLEVPVRYFVECSLTIVLVFFSVFLIFFSCLDSQLTSAVEFWDPTKY